jgi:glycosyltransferase involved in cell wall biosynthesis
MGRSHLFILPSFFEGVPLVLMEALACGCRILSTDLPGSREILGRDENPMIRLFPLPELATIDAPYKADEAGMEDDLALMLTEFISQILESPEPDMEIVREKTGPYSWQKVFQRIEKVYTQPSS